MINYADKVIVTTDIRAEHLKNKYHLSEVHTLRNCSRYEDVKKSELLRNEFNISSSKLLLIYHGAIHQARGVFDVVDAVKDIEDVAVVFMGKGAGLAILAEYIRSNNLTDRIFMKDAVKPDEVLPYVASADIGIQLFHYNFNHYTVISNKLLECIMAGIAVISNDYPEMKKIVLGEKIGEVVDYKNLESVKRIIIQ